MNNVYDHELIQEINESVDLLEYVSQVMELEKRGKNFWGHCWRHTDNTASFSVTPEKNSFYCFSCGIGGGIIHFLMHFESISFSEAVEKAASLAKMDLTKMCKSNTLAFLKNIRKLRLKSKEKYVHEAIPEKAFAKFSSSEITEWVNEGIEKSVLDLFEIKIDDFSNRIVYPVRDTDGTLINIKGRTRYPNYKKLKIPKYMNYYEVGVMDYFQGLDKTLSYIKEKKEIIVFESIKSVMKAYGWGYKNCVSAEKHSLTPEQIELLIRLRVDVVLAYDSDIDYWQNDVRQDIDKLRRLTNIFIIEDKGGVLGGKEAKNAPVDCGLEIWQELYDKKRKVV